LKETFFVAAVAEDAFVVVAAAAVADDDEVVVAAAGYKPVVVDVEAVEAVQDGVGAERVVVVDAVVHASGAESSSHFALAYPDGGQNTDRETLVGAYVEVGGSEFEMVYETYPLWGSYFP